MACGAEIEISRRADDKIHKLFLDPTGNHLVVAMDNGDNYYLHSRSTRPKKLKAWQVGGTSPWARSDFPDV